MKLTRKFVVRAALADDSNRGEVWIRVAGDRECQDSLLPRMIVKIVRPSSRRYVYAELRKIDKNYTSRYNKSPRVPIDDSQDTIVIAEWHRDFLGIRTTRNANGTCNAELRIEKSSIWVWSSVRASCFHPSVSVRLGTRLGVIGVVLGFLSVHLGLMGLDVLCYMPFGEFISGSLVALVGTLGIVAIQGPRRKISDR